MLKVTRIAAMLLTGAAMGFATPSLAQGPTVHAAPHPHPAAHPAAHPAPFHGAPFHPAPFHSFARPGTFHAAGRPGFRPGFARPGFRPLHSVIARHAPFARFTPAERAAWTRGRWFHRSWNGRFGWWWFAGGAWFWYAAPAYPYPTVVSDYYYEEPEYSAPGWWYCYNPPGYYPYVPYCYGAWQPVPAQGYGDEEYGQDQGPPPDQSQSYGNEQGPPPGYDQGPPPGYDQGPPNGYDQGPPPGYDQGPPQYDQGPPPGYSQQPPPPGN